MLPEPLLPIGPTTRQENVALASALAAFHEAPQADTMGAVGQFMNAYPSSAWQASLRLNAGLVRLRQGFFTRAGRDFRTAWMLAKDVSSPSARGVADQAVGELIRLEARLGHADVLEGIVAEVGDRPLLGGANEMFSNGKQSLAVMRSRPEEAFRCGPHAVAELISAIQQQPIIVKVLMTRAGPEGVSLARLMTLASDAGVATVPIVREHGREFAVPGVVHFTAGHFAAIVKHESGRYLLRDATFGGELWVSEAALNEEASGAMLVTSDRVPAGWREMSSDEAGTIWGRGLTTETDQRGPTPEDPSSNPSPNNCEGCASYRAHLMQVSLNVFDTPLRYTPAVGPAVRFTVTYNQRESHQPQTFTYSNLGAKWTTNWLSYVKDDPASAGSAVAVFLRGGGEEPHSGYNAGTGHFAMDLRDRAILVRTSSSPVRYERSLPDGSKEVFAQSDGASSHPRRVFMTEAIDPQGNALTFTYDAQLRLVAVTDAVGQVTTLAYDLPQDIWKITSVSDPFGRVATLTYDAAGRLERITDVIQISSAFTYAADGFMTSLTTPYGTSRFTVADSGWNRTLEMTDPLGGRERVEFRAVDSSIASSDPTPTVPTVSGATISNSYLQYRNTFYWNRRAMAAGAGDLTKAHLYHWLHARNQVNQMVPILESEKPALERRIWYLYPNQAGSGWEGDGRSPAAVARVLEDGTTQVSTFEYNSLGRVTKRTDPLGRETVYGYASNGIDVESVSQKRAGGYDVLQSRTYNSQHRPLTVTDASGQTTTYTYTALGQIATVTNAKNDTTTFTYDATTKQLLTVIGPVSGATTTFTYDGYGRLHTTTGSDGYVVAVEYDAFDRPIETTYPDGTTEQTQYRWLDVSRTKDRLGRWTTFTYDALRRQTSVRDPLGRVVQQEWCTCGSLDALIDAKGQRTTWERDLQGRVTREIRADGTTDTHYTYDVTGRLKTITDPKDQVTTYTYHADDSLASTGFTNETIATPDISHTYDTYYPRPVTMVDGNGTTTYSYVAAGTNGAGQLASVDGPFSNDTITYSYDELGRVLTRLLNSTGTEITYDALGRVSELEFPIGEFDYTYVGHTGRRASVTYPNNQTSTYSYFNDQQDFRLQTIHHKNPSATTLSKFAYTYDDVGNILTWRQERAGSAAKMYTLTHDRVDQLTSAVLADAATPTTILKRQAWSYDAAGNRTVDQTDDAVFSTTHDAMNRLDARAPGGPIVLSGTLDEAGTVTIDGTPAAVDALNNFRGTATLTGATTTVTVKARDYSGNETTKQYEIDAAGSTTTYTYDANGNLTADGTKTYFWNALNQLVEVKEGTTTIATFEYDGEGRRTEKVAAGLTHQYIYDAEDIVEERISGSSSDTIRYYHGSGIDEPLARTNASSVTTYYLADHLGSIVQETSASGAVTLEREYDPWGVAMQGASTSGYAFTGREWDAEVSLYYYRSRYYAPNSGKFIGEDPIGLAGGINFYSYVLGRPTNFIDPLGLQVKKNNSQSPVLVKREEFKDGFVWVAPGGTFDGPIDGVKPPNWNGDWYKVPDGTSVTIDEKGEPHETDGPGWWMPDSPDWGKSTDPLGGRKRNPGWEQRHGDWKYPPDDPSRDPSRRQQARRESCP